MRAPLVRRNWPVGLGHGAPCEWVVAVQVVGEVAPAGRFVGAAAHVQGRDKGRSQHAWPWRDGLCWVVVGAQ